MHVQHARKGSAYALEALGGLRTARLTSEHMNDIVQALMEGLLDCGRYLVYWYFVIILYFLDQLVVVLMIHQMKENKSQGRKSVGGKGHQTAQPPHPRTVHERGVTRKNMASIRKKRNHGIKGILDFQLQRSMTE